jgi:hypothetical protein
LAASAPYPLSGKAAITRHITILQNGQGNGARELRVAGRNEAGETGYWTKAIFDNAWSFKAIPLYFSEDAVLEVNSAEDNPRSERGPSLDKQYRGYSWNGGEKENDWEYAIPNFNILEGDCDFRISWRGETCALKLYPVEMWTYIKRDYLPGRTGSPKMFMVTLEIPDNAFEGLSAEFSAQLAQRYAQNDKQFYQYTIMAARHYLFLYETDNTDTVLFLTDGIVSNRYTEFWPARLIDDFDEIRRYHSPELLPGNSVTPGELAQKTALNKTFRNELKYQIRSLRWSKFTAVTFNSGYIPVHYIARITPLRFVDVPKIRTVTSFGKRLVLANSSYIHRISTLRIQTYERIIDELEARLRYYDELAKSGSWSNDKIF